jgi:hypothetical protein
MKAPSWPPDLINKLPTFTRVQVEEAPLMEAIDRERQPWAERPLTVRQEEPEAAHVASSPTRGKRKKPELDAITEYFAAKIHRDGFPGDGDSPSAGTSMDQWVTELGEECEKDPALSGKFSHEYWLKRVRAARRRALSSE